MFFKTCVMIRPMKGGGGNAEAAIQSSRIPLRAKEAAMGTVPYIQSGERIPRMKRMISYLLCALLPASMTAFGQTPLSSSTEPVQVEAVSLGIGIAHAAGAGITKGTKAIHIGFNSDFLPRTVSTRTAVGGIVGLEQCAPAGNGILLSGERSNPLPFMIAGPATKLTNLGAVKIVLGGRNFLYYILFSILLAVREFPEPRPEGFPKFPFFLSVIPSSNGEYALSKIRIPKSRSRKSITKPPHRT